MEVIVLNRKKGHQRTYVTRNHHGSVLFLFPLDFVCLFVVVLVLGSLVVAGWEHCDEDWLARDRTIKNSGFVLSELLDCL